MATYCSTLGLSNMHYFVCKLNHQQYNINQYFLDKNNNKLHIYNGRFITIFEKIF